jgi:hypothetical protein
MMNSKTSGRKYHGLFEVLSKHLLGWTDEKCDNSKLGWPIFQLRFEPGIS